MSVIKKVLANVVQTLTRSEQTIAKKNIGLGDSVSQPPVGSSLIPNGALVWDPNHTAVYRLLEDWSSSATWDSITKKVRVMPYPERDPLGIDILFSELNQNKPGTTALIGTLLKFGKPYIRLLIGNGEEVIFEYSEFRINGSNSSRIFRTWEPGSGNPPAKLDFEQITVTNSDNINLSSFSVNL